MALCSIDTGISGDPGVRYPSNLQVPPRARPPILPTWLITLVAGGFAPVAYTGNGGTQSYHWCGILALIW